MNEQARFISWMIAMTIGILFFLQLGIADPPTWRYQSLAFLFISTTGLYFFLINARRKMPDKFVQFFLGTLVFRLIAYGVFIFLVIMNDRPGATRNSLFFLITYILFTAIETGFLYRHVNRKT